MSHFVYCLLDDSKQIFPFHPFWLNLWFVLGKFRRLFLSQSSCVLLFIKKCIFFIFCLFQIYFDISAFCFLFPPDVCYDRFLVFLSFWFLSRSWEINSSKNFNFNYLNIPPQFLFYCLWVVWQFVVDLYFSSVLILLSLSRSREI